MRTLSIVGTISWPGFPWIAELHACKGPKKGLCQSRAIAAKPSLPRSCCISLAVTLPAVTVSILEEEVAQRNSLPPLGPYPQGLEVVGIQKEVDGVAGTQQVTGSPYPTCGYAGPLVARGR